MESSELRGDQPDPDPAHSQAGSWGWALHKLQNRVDLIDRLYSHLKRCSVFCDGAPRMDHEAAGEHSCSEAGCKPHACSPLRPSSIVRVHAVLRAALNYAVGWGWMDRNQAEYARLPKVGRRKPKAPSPEQVARLINLAWREDPEFGLFLWIAVTTGARRGELTSLRWRDCDLTGRILLFDENYVVRGCKKVFKPAKTDEDRDLSMDVLTAELLTGFRDSRAAALRPAGLELADDVFVFSPAVLA